MNIHCVIAEDEPLAAERLQEYAARIPYLVVDGVFDNGLSVAKSIQLDRPDLLLLDVNMPGLSGIELLEQLSVPCETIITTAYDSFALKGFDLNVTDYLLKPFSFGRFQQAIEKVKEQLELKAARPRKNFIFVKTEYRLEKIMMDEILFIEGMRDYRRIHTATRRIMTLQTFREFENEIPEQQLCRIHKSYMVAPEKIGSVERDRVRIGEHYLPVSDTYKRRFLDLLKG